MKNITIVLTLLFCINISTLFAQEGFRIEMSVSATEAEVGKFKLLSDSITEKVDRKLKEMYPAKIYSIEMSLKEDGFIEKRRYIVKKMKLTYTIEITNCEEEYAEYYFVHAISLHWHPLIEKAKEGSVTEATAEVGMTISQLKEKTKASPDVINRNFPRLDSLQYDKDDYFYLTDIFVTLGK